LANRECALKISPKKTLAATKLSARQRMLRSLWRIRHLPPFQIGIRHGKLEPTWVIGSPRHVGESRQVQLMRDGDRLGRTVTVFGQNEVRFPTTWVVTLERIGPVQKYDHIGILL
jgi:hypothetical protein